jgi:putative Mg2+ transporter-C (MgtC) family protein
MQADLTWYEVLLRLAAGAVLAGLVGLERESAGQDAGFRTHLLLGLGAALFGVVSVGAFDEFIVSSAASTNVRVDVTRIASYVAAGIGFIGGGAILKHAGAVRGITTAASIWAAAAIGLSAGLGMWSATAAATVIAIVALALLRPVSKWIGRRARVPNSLIILLRDRATARVALEVLDDPTTPPLKSVSIGEAPDDARVTQVDATFWSWPEDEALRALRAQLAEQLEDDLLAVSSHP